MGPQRRSRWNRGRTDGDGLYRSRGLEQSTWESSVSVLQWLTTPVPKSVASVTWELAEMPAIQDHRPKHQTQLSGEGCQVALIHSGVSESFKKLRSHRMGSL